MELPDLGSQCSEINCQQLNFLPLRCNCKKIFCSEHYISHTITCFEVQEQKQECIKQIENHFVCCHSQCGETSIIPLICERCKKHFCVPHRHLVQCSEEDEELLAAKREKYAAPIRQYNEAKAIVDKQLDEKLMNAKAKKSSGIATKIHLMRIKNKATGFKATPVAERAYFNIKHPRIFPDKFTPVFVSKFWTLGRTIDAVAEECNVKNNNNQSNSPKLRLFKETGEILSQDISEKICTLMDIQRIIEGENLILEYVSNNCKQLNLN